jgi:hypothetical protein
MSHHQCCNVGTTALFWLPLLHLEMMKSLLRQHLHLTTEAREQSLCPNQHL